MILSTVCFVNLLFDTFIGLLDIILKYAAHDCICQNSVVATSTDDEVTVSNMIDHSQHICLILYCFFLTCVDMERDCMVEYIVFV